MTTPGILARAPQLVVDGCIPIEAVTPATDTECYQCGVPLADIEGHVVPDLSRESMALWTLLCSACRDARMGEKA